MALTNLSFSRSVLPLLAIVSLVATTIFVVTGLPDREPQAPQRELARAPAELVGVRRVAGTGVVEPSSDTIQIGTALAGLVTDLFVKPGEYVTRNEPLFVVDTRALRSRLLEANASMAEARATITEAQAIIEEARAAELTAEQQLQLYTAVDDPAAVSRAEVIRAEGEARAALERRKLAEARAAAAQSRYESVQARAESARIELDRATVRAPISGEILAVNIRRGEFLATQSGGAVPYIEMGATRPLHVRIDVDQEQAPHVALGAAAVISPRGAADRQVKADFVRAEPLIVPKRSLINSAQERVDVRVLQIIYRLPRTNGLFRVGQQVDAYIPAKQQRNRPDAQRTAD